MAEATNPTETQADMPIEVRQLPPSDCAKLERCAGWAACHLNNECQVILQDGQPTTDAACRYAQLVG